MSYTQCRYVHSIQVAPELIYIATEGGILRYDPFAKRWLFPFTVSNGLPDNFVFVAAMDVATGLLWCSTRQAISMYELDAHLWRNFYLDEVGLRGGDPVVSIGFSPGKVWFETESGTIYFSPAQQLVLQQAGEDSRSDDENIIWYGRRGFEPFPLDYYFLPNSLLFIDDAARYYIQDAEARTFRLTYYQMDPWQMLWAGTDGMGMLAGDARIQYMVPLPFGLLNPDVRAICRRGQEFWLGGVQKAAGRVGVTLWDRKRQKWQYFEPQLLSQFYSADVYDIASYNRHIWFATAYGLSRYSPDKDRWKTFTVFSGLDDNQVFSLCPQDSVLWVGTKSGLNRVIQVSGKKDSVRIESVSRRQDKVAVYDLKVQKNVLWAATNYGLYIYDLANDKAGYYRGADGPGPETLLALDLAGDSLWVATLDRVEVYNLEEQRWMGGPGRRFFAAETPLDLVATPSVVWVGTTGGLYRFDVHRGYWRKYTVTDGLLHPRVQKLLLEGDFLWIGSPAGLTRFYWNSPLRVD